MSTYFPKANDLKRQWFVVDATDVTVGRLSTAVADLRVGFITRAAIERDIAVGIDRDVAGGVAVDEAATVADLREVARPHVAGEQADDRHHHKQFQQSKTGTARNPRSFNVDSRLAH